MWKGRFRLTAAKAEDRPAGRKPHFERPQQSLGVLSFAFGIESGVMKVYFLLEPANAVQLILQLELAADGGIDAGGISSRPPVNAFM